MKLHRVPFLRGVLNTCHCVVSPGHQLKTRRQFERLIAVRHPHRKLFSKPLKQHRLRNDIDFGVAVLALESGRTLLLEQEACAQFAKKNKISLTTI